MDLKQFRTIEGLQLGASYLIKIVLGMAVAASAIGRDWEALLLAAVALALTFVPALLERSYKFNLPIEFELAVALFVYASIYLGEIKNYYGQFWWWDIMLHTASGAIFGFIGFLILYILSYQKRLRASAFLIAFFAFCFAAAMGALWEVFEFSMDSTFGFNMQKNGLADTMRDLMADAAGAAFTCLVGYLYIKNRSKNLFGRLIKRFMDRNPAFKK